MDGVWATVAAGVGLFVGTNLEDMVVLAVLNLSSRAGGQPKAWHIWAGYSGGISVLISLCLLAALGLKLVPENWVWLLGFLPFGLGLRKLVMVIRANRYGHYVSPAVATRLTGVMGLTIANGGDNLAAYPPVFRTLTPAATVMTLVVFAACVLVWCVAGSLLVSHKMITDLVERWGHWIVPVVFMLIGVFIIARGGVLGRVL